MVCCFCLCLNDVLLINISIKTIFVLTLFKINLLLVFNLISCTENKKTNKISFVNKNTTLVNKLDRKKRSLDKNQYIYYNSLIERYYESKTTEPPKTDVTKCQEHSNFQYYHYDLESLKYSAILNLSQYFYKALKEQPSFILTCRKISLDSQDLPSLTMFGRSVLKFVANRDFIYRDTKGNRFVQSIAWIAHKHIVHWSQTHLTRHMRNKWSILWQNIIDSIHISTDNYCYWRVEFLFNGDKLAFANKQLEQLENGEIISPTLYHNNTAYSYNQYAIENFNESPLDPMIN